MMKYAATFFAVAVLANFLLTASAVEFDSPVILVESDQAISFAMNPRGALGVDAQGQAHLVYSAPDDETPGDQIQHLVFAQGQIQGTNRIDNGPLGGKHPFMDVSADGDIAMVWQDYRNTTAAGNYIDNIEIYLDEMTVNDPFLDTDIRISHTNSGHSGDNGYTPTLSISPNGKTYVAWYDFALDGNNSNIYVRSSSNGGFDDVTGIEPFRITGQGKGGDLTPHWMPDITGTEEGAYVVWGVQENFQSYLRLQGRMVNEDSSLGEIEEIVEDASTFFDPPRVIADEQGDVFLAYSQKIDGLSHVYLKKRNSSGEWSEAIMLDDDSLSASQLSVIYAGETLYSVWQEDLGGIYQIVFGAINASALEVVERTYLSGDFDDARTPTIAIQPLANGYGQLSVAWIERDDEGNRSIVLRQELQSDVKDWSLH